MLWKKFCWISYKIRVLSGLFCDWCKYLIQNRIVLHGFAISLLLDFGTRVIFYDSIKLSDFSTNFWTLLKLLTLALSLKKSLKLSTNLHKKYSQPVKSDPSLLNGKIWPFWGTFVFRYVFLPKEKLVSKEINKITTF